MENYRNENGKLLATDKNGDTNIIGLSELTVRSGSYEFLTGESQVRLHNTSQLLIDGVERGAKSSCGSVTVTLESLMASLRDGFNAAPADVDPMLVFKSVYAQAVIDANKPAEAPEGI